jgi:hypothetical protein
MAKGVKLNYAAIGKILKSEPGLIAALKAEAEAMASDSGGEVEQYETDRAAFQVSVPAHEQAINGKLTKALGRRGK